MKMKTKRFAAVLAVVLTFACCAVAWGDVIEPGQPRRPRPVPYPLEDTRLEAMATVDVWTTAR